MGFWEDLMDREGLTEPWLCSAWRWWGSGTTGSTGSMAAGRIRPRAEPGQTILITPWVIYWTWGIVAFVLISQQLFKVILAGVCSHVEQLPLTPKLVKW